MRVKVGIMIKDVSSVKLIILIRSHLRWLIISSQAREAL